MKRAIVPGMVMLLVSGLHGAVSLAAPPATAATTLTEVTSFGPNPGELRLFEYAPSGLPANPALVVVLHGCNQSAAKVAQGSGWPSLADRYKFRVLLPQSDDNNKCFGIDDADTLRGGGGDADSVRQMVTWAKAHRSVDASRVYVAGFSSGAMFTNVMLGAYPDLFAAGGSSSGIPYRCADDQLSQTKCGLVGRDLSPQAWGRRARAANPGSWSWPRMVVVHGSTDPVVKPMNLTEQMQQWTDLNGIDQTADASDYVNGYPHKVYKNAAGESRVETYSITGSGHNMFADQGPRVGQCGDAGILRLTFDVNFCAAYWMGRFFGVVTGGATSTTLLNVAATDGAVKAWPGGLGSTVVADEASGLRIGRTNDTRYGRAILSVDTSSIPDDSTITRAWLFISKESTQGDPFSDPFGNKIRVDVQSGCLGSSCTTQAGDWGADATAGDVASIGRPGSSVSWSGDFSAAGRSAINKTGLTQIRLRFRWNQLFAQSIDIDNGTKARLVVEY